jgi:hypothetical protein
MVAVSTQYDGYVHFEDIVAPKRYESCFENFDTLIDRFQVLTWYDRNGQPHAGGMTLGEFGTYIARLPRPLFHTLPEHAVEPDDIYEHKIESAALHDWRRDLRGETKELYEILLTLDPELTGGSLFYSANEMARSTAFTFDEKKQWLTAGVTIEDDARMLTRDGLRSDEAVQPFKNGKTIGYAMLFNMITVEEALTFLYQTPVF